MRTLDWVRLATQSTYGNVAIQPSETVSGLGYVSMKHGTWVGEDDVEVCVNKQILICCRGQWARPISRTSYSATMVKPDPVVVEDEGPSMVRDVTPEAIEEIAETIDIPGEEVVEDETEEENEDVPKRKYTRKNKEV